MLTGKTHMNHIDVSLPTQITWPCPISREPRNVIQPKSGETGLYRQTVLMITTLRNLNFYFIIPVKG